MNIAWRETTLRRGTKTPSVCRDAFITDSRGKWAICFVGNGKMVARNELSKCEAFDIIRECKLTAVKCQAFNHCYTYRTERSNKLVAELLAQLKRNNYDR